MGLYCRTDNDDGKTHSNSRTPNPAGIDQIEAPVTMIQWLLTQFSTASAG
jgi:hypothetical protein